MNIVLTIAGSLLMMAVIVLYRENRKLDRAMSQVLEDCKQDKADYQKAYQMIYDETLAEIKRAHEDDRAFLMRTHRANQESARIAFDRVLRERDDALLNLELALLVADSAPREEIHTYIKENLS